MWRRTETFDRAPGLPRHAHADELGLARTQMQAALALLDEYSSSAAAATLDMAINLLDRELAMRAIQPPSGQAE